MEDVDLLSIGPAFYVGRLTWAYFVPAGSTRIIISGFECSLEIRERTVEFERGAIELKEATKP